MTRQTPSRKVSATSSSISGELVAYLSRPGTAGRSAPDQWVAWISNVIRTTVAETASDFLIRPAVTSRTSIDALIATQDASVERDRSRDDHVLKTQDHKSKYLDEWHKRAADCTTQPVPDLLSSLWNNGFSWRDIAGLLGVSVSAVQKWRHGSKMSPANMTKLRDFVGAYTTVAANKIGVDVAGWLDVPLLTGVPITPMDLWSGENPTIFFEYALGDAEPEKTLDDFEPRWRAKYLNHEFELFRDAAGQTGVRMRNR
jgi:transcriptional regulator with XRE-family HTH domain